MRRFSDRHALHTLSELNVTPLLDLAFVLLIIFMITTPLMENSTDLVLPSGEAKQPANMDSVRTVSIHADDTITLNDEFVTPGILAAKLAALLESQPDLGVLIRPHRDLPVQKFSEVLDAVKRAGVKRIGFVQTTKE
ncbi:MAG: biopolymer transporter ExbD [Chthoniobacteraceae bacterium]